jgi:hypothetical protein
MTQCSGDVLICVRQNGFSPTVSSSPPHSSDHKPENALVDDDSTHYCGSFKPNEWWKIDFKTNVVVSSYQIRTDDGRGWIYNWKVEVSTDNSNWALVHTQTNKDCKSFPSFPTGYSQPFRYFRITGTGPAAGGGSTYNIAFYYIKFIGSYGVYPTKTPTQAPTPTFVKLVYSCAIARNPFSLSSLIMTIIAS